MSSVLDSAQPSLPSDESAIQALPAPPSTDVQSTALTAISPADVQRAAISVSPADVETMPQQQVGENRQFVGWGNFAPSFTNCSDVSITFNVAPH